MNKHEILACYEALLKDFKKMNAKSGSVEWYLMGHLRRTLDVLPDSFTKTGIENALTPLEHFCTDSMDWDSDLFRRISDLNRAARELVMALKK